MTISTSKYSIIQEKALNNKDIEITVNGTYTAGTGYSGFNVVRVNVPEPQYTRLTINPSINSQTFTVEDIYQGYSPIIVNPVTSSIDSNIKPENIIKGKTILGVAGSVEFLTEELEVTPTRRKQTKTPIKDGYSKVVINAVTSDIDGNILPENILQGVQILGVAGTVVENKPQSTRRITANGTYIPDAGFTGFSEVEVNVNVEHEELTINPKITEQRFTAINQYHGYSPVIVNPVTSSIDSNITSSNIKKDITILGVTGTCIELNAQQLEVNLTDKNGNTYTPSGKYNGINRIVVHPTNLNRTINPSTTEQIFNIENNYSGNGIITVNPVTNEIDPNIVPENIRKNVSILGVTGTLEQLKGQVKTITRNGTFTPDSGYNGFSSVTVDVNTVHNQDISIGENGIYEPEEGYTGFSKVTVDINTVNNTNLTVTPKTTNQTFTPPSPYTGYEKVTVNKVTSSIDSNIKAANIKKNITILGVTGTYEEPLQSKSLVVNQNTATTLTITPDSGYTGLSSVNVDLSWIEQQLQALNAGDTDTSAHLQDKTVLIDGTQTTVQITADSGYTGLGTVTVDCNSISQYIDDLKGQAIDTKLEKILNGSGTELATDVSTIRNYACYHLSSLETAKLNNALVIGDYAFANTNLSNLTIRTNVKCELGSHALDNTPIASDTGIIYVPSSLLAEYKADSDWAPYKNRIQSL